MLHQRKCKQCGAVLSGPKRSCAECGLSAMAQRRKDGCPEPAMTSCGDFLEVLLELLRREPEYVPGADIARHLALLKSFLKCSVMRWDTASGRERKVPVARQPLDQLPLALESWLASWRSPEHFLLLHTYAIGTAELIWAHAVGQDEWTSEDVSRRWRVAPVLPESIVSPLLCRRVAWEDVGFKRLETGRIKGQVVVVRIPEEGRCEPLVEGFPLLKPGVQFLFSIERCHLSSGFYDYPHYRAVDDRESATSLASNFRLWGRIRFPQEQDTTSLGWYVEKGPKLQVPIRWITHVLQHNSETHEVDTCPVPSWLLGGSYRAVAATIASCQRIGVEDGGVPAR